MARNKRIRFSKENNLSIIKGMTTTTKIFIAAALVFITATTFYGCKKANDRKPVCRIVTAAFTSLGKIERLSYNSDSKIGLITNGNLVTNFDYSGKLMIARLLDSGRFSKKDIITLNTDGLASNVRTENNPAGTNWINNAYEYNGQELIRSVLTNSENNDSTISVYAWQDHNMISITSGGMVQKLEYYKDMPTQKGDYFSFAQLLQGYEFVRNRNPLKSFAGATFTYEFNPAGNISALAISFPGSSNNISYEYQCN